MTPEQIKAAEKLCGSRPEGTHYQCNQPIEYVSATPPEVPYSGWKHVDRALDANHGCVPKAWLM